MRFRFRRPRISPRQIAVTAGVLAGIAALAVAGRLLTREIHAIPRHEPGVVVSLLLSLGRLIAGYVISVAFAVVFGIAAATRPLVRKTLMPVLDIGQSVPFPALFPVFVILFVEATHEFFGSGRLGLELACVFLVFTAMVWNLAFGVFEGITQIPGDLREAADVLHLTGTRRLMKVYVPAFLPKLIYNSIASWANGWYFLTLNEVIDKAHRVEGIGSYLSDSLTKDGSTSQFLVGLGLVLLVVATMEFALWRPLVAWSGKFRYDAGTVEHYDRSAVLDWWRRSKLALALRGALHAAAARVQEWARATRAKLPATAPRTFDRISQTLVPVGIWGFFGAIALAAIAGIVSIALALLHPWPADAATVPLALGKSTLRIAAAYGLSLAWTVPLAMWAGRSPRADRIVTPMAEVLSAVPAVAVWPLLQHLLQPIFGTNVTAVVMLTTGMQWYLLFNCIEGVKRIPMELREAGAMLGLSRAQTARRLLLPAMMPALVTGSLTAVGGGWNALIVAERFQVGDKLYECDGIGSRLLAASEGGSTVSLALNVVAMILVVAILNRVVWHRLYDFAETRFRFDA